MHVQVEVQGRRWPQHGHHWLTPCKHNAFSQNLYSYSLVETMHALPQTMFLGPIGYTFLITLRLYFLIFNIWQDCRAKYFYITVNKNGKFVLKLLK